MRKIQKVALKWRPRFRHGPGYLQRETYCELCQWMVLKSSVRQKWEGIRIPRVKLLVSATRKAHSYQVRSENYQQRLVLIQFPILATNIFEE